MPKTPFGQAFQSYNITGSAAKQHAAGTRLQKQAAKISGKILLQFCEKHLVQITVPVYNIHVYITSTML